MEGGFCVGLAPSTFVAGVFARILRDLLVVDTVLFLSSSDDSGKSKTFEFVACFLFTTGAFKVVDMSCEPIDSTAFNGIFA